jgi:hypothetical protein
MFDERRAESALIIVPDDVPNIGSCAGTEEQLHVPTCIFDQVDGMCFALGPGLTFAPFRMYQFFRLGSPIYQGRHLNT